VTTSTVKRSPSKKSNLASMSGADYIAEFLHQRGTKHVFLVTGGACAFIVDAIARHSELNYFCFLHEQSAAMAANTPWYVDKTVGVAMATSGPGATNLVTGIACSYFDSIPALHITGQVNQVESAAHLGTKVRQAGFQETKIVEMVKPITKYAVQVKSISELKKELAKAYNIAIDGRMGPVLIDVPMNVQQEDAGNQIEYTPPEIHHPDEKLLVRIGQQLTSVLKQAKRPLVLFGGGLGLAGVSDRVIQWLELTGLRFVSSWSGVPYFNHDSPMYCGTIGVYGNRGANAMIQNCDALIVLGSRLDNRQRTGNPKNFAPDANVYVIDIDSEELKKYKSEGYKTSAMDLRHLPRALDHITIPAQSTEWIRYISEMRTRYLDKDTSSFARDHKTISPYLIIQKINEMIDRDAIVSIDTGAISCWFYQIFHRTEHTLLGANGMGPMGYGLPAAIGAAMTDSDKQVICFVGDGGFQMSIQELQMISHHNLNIKVVIMNNYGYGIIKQFQDAYFQGRYEASGEGYSVPDFKAIADAYGIPAYRIDEMNQLTSDLFKKKGPIVVDVTLDPNTLIEPKVLMGRPINDQFPYLSEQEFASANPFIKTDRIGRS